MRNTFLWDLGLCLKGEVKMSESIISEPVNLVEHPLIVKKGQIIKILVDNVPMLVFAVPDNYRRYLFQSVAIPESLEPCHINMLLKEFRERGYISSVRIIVVTKQIEDKAIP